ncbi:transcriptional repressor NrdR [Christensenellaceae bacterium NSJ-63]|uniref:Transcriptional repressor NrdR n=1 Tax=Guopingia tenuis TaxID=2763656 RepID=A0A926HWJ5_9FIRM|nr:transcriptional regulator NrdR [Guopingia tenuis]MBC8537741.1 transcriptional repressor NrdR [Guopingia tenuis]
MKCIYCGYPESKVVDSRPLDEGVSTRRRRECLKCGRRFTTYEKAEQMPMMVIKKDGSRENFDINKIKRGIMKACEKRNVSTDKIEDMALEIERQVYNSVEAEIPAEKIGDMVMDSLKDVDQVAYVRFASVYREFKDVSTFMEELKKLVAEKK